MTAPTRRDVADYLAALTDEELASTIAEARGITHAEHARTSRNQGRVPRRRPHGGPPA
ncbi:hypothetical protein [Rhodococcus ruber]|uniref:hypothetical protein n=1 Tax=Rhodococcus ruber TaxID=1830 RepID=UPI001F3B2B91|nr:hypothetical protein [Rhodococcus ruber]MCF8781245.1 hypothetical protein [Rhodococcus ruber]